MELRKWINTHFECMCLPAQLNLNHVSKKGPGDAQSKDLLVYVQCIGYTCTKCIHFIWQYNSCKDVVNIFKISYKDCLDILKIHCPSTISDTFYQNGLTLIPAWICNHIHFKEWDEIIYPFLNFSGATIEVWEQILNNFIQHLTGHAGIKVNPC